MQYLKIPKYFVSNETHVGTELHRYLIHILCIYVYYTYISVLAISVHVCKYRLIDVLTDFNTIKS